MDRKEFNIRLEQIKSLISDHDYEGAMEVCDIIDWSRSRSVSTLCTVSEIYKVNREYERARDVLLIAYNINRDSKRIVYALCELSIKLGDIVQAVNYRNEFERLAPGSADSLILTYRIYEAQEVSLEERIELLEAYKRLEGCTEKWGYELAYLYHRVGLGTKCAEECDEIILMFAEGKYVRMAMELKQLHKPLTALQQEQLEYMERLEAGEEFFDEDAEGEYEEDEYEEDAEGEEPEYEGDAGYEEGQGYVTEAEPDGSEIEVKQLDFKKKDSTINIQEELSKGVREFFQQQEGAGDAVLLQSASDSGILPATGELQSTGDFAGEAAGAAADIAGGVAETAGAAAGIAAGVVAEATAEATASDAGDTSEFVWETASIPSQEIDPADEVVRIKEVEPGEPNVATVSGYKVDSKKKTARPENSLNKMLSQEGDGQISMVVPEPEAIEKQITGQIDLDGYLSEWDRQRKDSQRKRIADAKRKNIEQTNRITLQLEDRLPRITDELPDVEEIKKNVTLPEEDVEAAKRSLAKLKERYFTGELPHMSAMENAPDPEDYVPASTTGPIPADQLPPEEEYPAEEEYVTEELPEEDIPLEDYPTEELPTVEYVTQQLPSEELPEEDLPAEDDPSVFDTSRIPTDEFATGQIPYMDDDPDDTIRLEGVPGDVDEVEEIEDIEEDLPAEDYEGDIEEEPAEDLEEELAEELAEAEPEEEYEEDIEEEIADEAGYEEDVEEEIADEAGYEEDVEEEIADEAGYEEDVEEEIADEAEYEDDIEEDFDEASEAAGAHEYKDEELEEIFGSLLQMRNMKEKISKALDLCSMDPVTGNVLISGNEKGARVELAMGLAKCMKKYNPEFKGRVYKIKAEALNEKDIRKAVPGINDGALIVEDASKLTVNTLDTLAKSINHSVVRMFIILETDKKDVKKLSHLRSYFDKMFDVRIEVPTYSNNDLVEYAMKYAREREYTIDDMGKLALSKRIDEMHTFDHPVTISEVEEIMDAAMDHVDKKSLTLIKDILLSRRYDKDDLIILRERDFEQA